MLKPKGGAPEISEAALVAVSKAAAGGVCGACEPEDFKELSGLLVVFLLNGSEALAPPESAEEAAF